MSLARPTTPSPAWQRLLAGPVGLLLVLAYIAGVTYLVTQEPRHLLWRLLFLGGLLLIYYIPQPMPAKLALAAVVVFILVPFLGLSNPFLLEIGFQICAFGTLALGLNIVVGFAGLLDLGYIAFYAVGAYLWAFYGSQQSWNLDAVAGSAPVYDTFPFDANLFWLFLALGTIVAGVTGIALGLPVLRLRGDYLAIVTLGFGEVIRVLANNLDKPINITNGPQGITPIQRPDLPLFLIHPGLIAWLSDAAGRPINHANVYGFFFYLLALVILLFTIVVARRLENSKLGRAWTAIREDEVAAIAMGVPLVRSKLAAFAIGASFSGAMGVVFAANRTFVSPESFSLTASISILVMVILGGLGSIPGVIVGAAVVTLLNIDFLQTLSLELSRLRQGTGTIPLLGMPWAELPNQLDPARYQRLVFGLILIVMMIFRPEGIIPSQRQRLEMHAHDAAPEETA
ncbi:MAG: branched-chain amino acid ABC transporter permease [Caldilineaceae bacterium]|nr:branched-chain amino acid ABC transporter permease [Caldilineaceae bacterium]